MNGQHQVDPAPTLTVELGDVDASEWDAFVTTAEGGTFCHLSAWSTIMADALGHEVLQAVARDATGRLHGVLPLTRVKSRLFGHFLVSMPFLNYGGPVGTPPARRALTEWARSLAAGTGADLLELRWRPSALAPALPEEHPPAEASLPGEELPSDMQLTRRKVTVLLPLPDDPQHLWEKGLKSKLRSQVRRPMKEGYEARHGPDEVHSFYEIFARNMRDLGTPVLPKRLFTALTPALGDTVHFTTVYDGSDPIASGCGFFFGNEFEMTWASSLRSYNRTAPNMLLYWRMMENAIERGASTFNFGRCTPGGGTHRFKLQWGGTDEPLPWAVWSPTGSVATPNPDQGKFRLATAAWKKLPLGVSRWLGPPLARRIP